MASNAVHNTLGVLLNAFLIFLEGTIGGLVGISIVLPDTDLLNKLLAGGIAGGIMGGRKAMSYLLVARGIGAPIMPPRS